jgi:hypothetical protein
VHSTAENNQQMTSSAVTLSGTTTASTLMVGSICANNFTWSINNPWTIFRDNAVNVHFDYFYGNAYTPGTWDPGGAIVTSGTQSGLWVAFNGVVQ